MKKVVPGSLDREALGDYVESPASPNERDIFVHFDNDAKVRAF
jgi:hypothetical protein